MYPVPTVIKARPTEVKNDYSVLFKLEKWRHFQWVNDPYAFSQKKDLLVWRGAASQEWRKFFVEHYWNHPLCNVGQTNKPKENAPWQKEYLSIKKQLEYKFIVCPEGNDVATSLKWVMSSNSLLYYALNLDVKHGLWKEYYSQAFIYVEVKKDYSDLEDKILYLH